LFPPRYGGKLQPRELSADSAEPIVPGVRIDQLERSQFVGVIERQPCAARSYGVSAFQADRELRDRRATPKLSVSKRQKTHRSANGSDQSGVGSRLNAARSSMRTRTCRVNFSRRSAYLHAVARRATIGAEERMSCTFIRRVRSSVVSGFSRTVGLTKSASRVDRDQPACTVEEPRAFQKLAKTSQMRSGIAEICPEHGPSKAGHYVRGGHDVRFSLAALQPSSLPAF
jgi:hypothetical protein